MANEIQIYKLYVFATKLQSFIMNYNCCHRQEDWQQSPAELSPISLDIYLYIITLFNKLEIFKVLIVITDIYIIIIVIDKIVTNPTIHVIYKAERHQCCKIER